MKIFDKIQLQFQSNLPFVIYNKPDKKEIIAHAYFTKALGKNKKALQVFEAYAYSHKKEYIEWITEVKTEETRNKRMATAIEWIAEGKSRNWKYAAK